MKRRRFLKAMVAAPAAPALFAQQSPAPLNPVPDTPVPATAAASAVEELPKLESTVADAAAEMRPGFFNAQQFTALRKLSDLLMPSLKELPGALDTGAPEFLDFLIGFSLPDRQQLYRIGLDALNAQARKRFERPFAELDTTQAEALLAPLRRSGLIARRFRSSLPSQRTIARSGGRAFTRFPPTSCSAISHTSPWGVLAGNATGKLPSATGSISKVTSRWVPASTATRQKRRVLTAPTATSNKRPAC